MTYKNKITALSAVIAALAVIYILTIIFDPQRRGSRSDLYSWIDPGQADRITGIGITRDGETLTLARNGGKWFVTRGGKDYPARLARVDDLISALTKRDSYPVRSSSASSHERLSLTPEKASAQITVSAGAGPPLLDLLIGQADVMGRNVYLRRLDQNEARSGEDRFSTYTNTAQNFWYNLRLFPENEDGKLGVQDVQKLIVYPPEKTSSQTFTRKGREWAFSFELANPDFSKVESYIQDILGVSGDDFIDSVSASDPLFNAARIEMELGSGVTKTLRFGPPDENEKRYVTVSGSDLVYSVQGWSVRKMFVNTDTFK